MLINIEVSLEIPRALIDKCNKEVVQGYFDRVSEKAWHLLCLPFYIVFLCFYGLYLAVYGILVAIEYVQKGELLDLIFDIENVFIRVPLLIIGFPICIVLYIVSTAFPLIALIVLWILFAVVFFLQCSIIDHSNNAVSYADILALSNKIERLLDLEKLLEMGEITEEEYQEQKTQYMSELKNI